MGVSNKNAQDNIQPKGNKKPLQVLHISKKDTQKNSQEIDNEQTNSQEEIKKESIAIKPQVTKDESEKEIEDSNENTKSFDGKTLKVAFLEVNPETRKLVLSEKKASLVSKLTSLELGQLIEGEVLAVKPYGFFIDLGLSLIHI